MSSYPSCTAAATQDAFDSAFPFINFETHEVDPKRFDRQYVDYLSNDAYFFEPYHPDLLRKYCELLDKKPTYLEAYCSRENEFPGQHTIVNSLVPMEQSVMSRLMTKSKAPSNKHVSIADLPTEFSHPILKQYGYMDCDMKSARVSLFSNFVLKSSKYDQYDKGCIRDFLKKRDEIFESVKNVLYLKSWNEQKRAVTIEDVKDILTRSVNGVEFFKSINMTRNALNYKTKFDPKTNSWEYKPEKDGLEVIMKSKDEIIASTDLNFLTFMRVCNLLQTVNGNIFEANKARANEFFDVERKLAKTAQKKNGKDFDEVEEIGKKLYNAVYFAMETHVVSNILDSMQKDFDFVSSIYTKDGFMVRLYENVIEEEFMERVNQLAEKYGVEFKAKPFKDVDAELEQQLQIAENDFSQLLDADSEQQQTMMNYLRARFAEDEDGRPKKKSRTFSLISICIEPGESIDDPFPSTEPSPVPFQLIPRSYKVCKDHFCDRVFKVNSKFYIKFYIDKERTLFGFETVGNCGVLTVHDLNIKYNNVYYAASKLGIIAKRNFRFIPELLNDPTFPTYDDVECRPPLAPPNEIQCKRINTWKDYRFANRRLARDEVKQEHVAFLDDFMTKLIGPSVTEKDLPSIAKNFIKCSAGKAIRQPHIRQPRMVIYSGEEGSGKSRMCELLSYVFGKHVSGIFENPKRDLFGEFNSSLLYHNVIFIDEIDPDTFGKLNHNGDCKDGQTKGTISGNKITINAKGKAQFTIDSYLYFGGGCTNFPSAIPRGRRYFHIPVLSTCINNTQYWNEFHKKIEEDEFAQHIYWHLYYYSEDRPDWKWDGVDQKDVQVARGHLYNHPCEELMFRLFEKLTENEVLKLPFDTIPDTALVWSDYPFADNTDKNRKFLTLSDNKVVCLYTVIGAPNCGWVALNSEGAKMFIDDMVRSEGLQLTKHFGNKDKLANYFLSKPVWNSVVVAGNPSGYIADPKNPKTTTKRLLKINLAEVQKILNSTAVENKVVA